MVKRAFCIILILILLVSLGISVSANDNFFVLLDEEYQPHGTPITFSVNQKEEVYVGFADGQINVYDKNGTYLRSYFYRGKTAYVLFFDKDNDIILHTARGDVLYCYSENAHLLDSRGASEEQITNFINIRQRSEFEIGDNTYRAIKRLWYWRIERVDQNNDITIIYETPTQVIWMCFFKTFGFVAFFVIILLIVLVRPLLKRRKLRKEGKEIKYEKPWWR